MARRFGSAIISNTDSTLFIYFYVYMPVKECNIPDNGIYQPAG